MAGIAQVFINVDLGENFADIIIVAYDGLINAHTTLARILRAIISVITHHRLINASCNMIAGVGCAGIIIVAVYSGMATACSRIARVGCAGIIVVAVYSGMAATCQRITGIGGASIAVVTILASDIGLDIHIIGLIYDLKVKKDGLPHGLRQSILLQCRRGGIDASGRAAGVNGAAVAIIAAYCFVVAAIISRIIPGAGIAVIAIYSGVWNRY